MKAAVTSAGKDSGLGSSLEIDNVLYSHTNQPVLHCEQCMVGSQPIKVVVHPISLVDLMSSFGQRFDELAAENQQLSAENQRRADETRQLSAENQQLAAQTVVLAALHVQDVAAQVLSHALGGKFHSIITTKYAKLGPKHPASSSWPRGCRSTRSSLWQRLIK